MTVCASPGVPAAREQEGAPPPPSADGDGGPPPAGFAITVDGAYAARLARGGGSWYPERWTLDGPEPYAVPLPGDQGEEPGTEVQPMGDGRVLIRRLVAGRNTFSLLYPTGPGTGELPLGAVESPEGTRLRLLPPAPGGERAYALAVGSRSSAVWLVAGGPFGPELLAEVEGHCSGGVWLDRAGRLLALDRRTTGRTKTVVVDLGRGGAVSPLLQIAPHSDDRLLLADLDSGLLLIRSDAPSPGQYRLGWGVLGSTLPVRFPQCLRLPDCTVTPFAIQPGQVLTPEQCAVALRCEGAYGNWVGVWRPADRRVRHLPAPEGWLPGAGLWTEEGVLRLPYATRSVPCGVARWPAPGREAGREPGRELTRAAGRAPGALGTPGAPGARGASGTPGAPGVTGALGAPGALGARLALTAGASPASAAPAAASVPGGASVTGGASVAGGASVPERASAPGPGAVPGRASGPATGLGHASGTGPGAVPDQTSGPATGLGRASVTGPVSAAGPVSVAGPATDPASATASVAVPASASGPDPASAPTSAPVSGSVPVSASVPAPVAMPASMPGPGAASAPAPGPAPDSVPGPVVAGVTAHGAGHGGGLALALRVSSGANGALRGDAGGTLLGAPQEAARPETAAGPPGAAARAGLPDSAPGALDAPPAPDSAAPPAESAPAAVLPAPAPSEYAPSPGAPDTPEPPEAEAPEPPAPRPVTLQQAARTGRMTGHMTGRMAAT
ncbi:hypothetical protein [Streptomyces sp. BBFR109]|uniref:hypothetical protein n=1 Tax=Streptomyces sp. BBFR109 TaxID=3448172 RepID=UPI003F76584F